MPLIEALEGCLSIGGMVYQPTVVADLLGVDRALLPLFAALVGTDYGSFSDLFDASCAGSNRSSFVRIKRVIDALSRVKKKDRLIAEVVQAVVHDLLLIYPSRLKADEILDALVPAITQYTQAPRAEIAVLAKDPTDSPERAVIKRRLLNAYASGYLKPTALEILEHRSLLISPVIEDPSRRSAHVYCTSDVRRWIYAILGAAFWGGEVQGIEREDEPEGRSIDGASLDEEFENEEGDSRLSTVTEHLRLGERLSTKIVHVDQLADLFATTLNAPMAAKPEDLLLSSRSSRLRVLHVAFSSSGILAEEPDFDSPVVRLALLVVSLRQLTIALEDLEPWTRAHRKAALAVGVVLFLDEPFPDFQAAKVPAKRSIQRSSELVHTLQMARLLADVLLLSEILEPPHRLFHGTLFHFFLECADGGDSDSDSDSPGGIERHLSIRARELLGALSAEVEKDLPADPVPHHRGKKKKKKIKSDGDGDDCRGTSSSNGSSRPPTNLFELLSLSDG
jgi:hypothetical protein